MRLKHIDSPDLETATRKIGLDLSLLEKAAEGDLQAVKVIGELGRRGRLATELSPQLAQNYSQAITGIVEYNRALATIYSSAGKGAIALEKGILDTSLNADKLRNQRKELHTDNKIALAAEKARHSFAVSLSQTKGYVDAQIVQVDRQAQIAEVHSRPQIKQVQADQDLQRKLVNNYLEKGEDFAPIDELTPRKKYRTLTRIKTALGF